MPKPNQKVKKVIDSFFNETPLITVPDYELPSFRKITQQREAIHAPITQQFMKEDMSPELKRF